MLRKETANKFREIVGKDYYLDSVEDLISYSYDSSATEAMPDAVLLPGSTEQVSEIMKVANEEEIPITPAERGRISAEGQFP